MINADSTSTITVGYFIVQSKNMSALKATITKGPTSVTSEADYSVLQGYDSPSEWKHQHHPCRLWVFHVSRNEERPAKWYKTDSWSFGVTLGCMKGLDDICPPSYKGGVLGFMKNCANNQQARPVLAQERFLHVTQKKWRKFKKKNKVLKD